MQVEKNTLYITVKDSYEELYKICEKLKKVAPDFYENNMAKWKDKEGPINDSKHRILECYDTSYWDYTHKYWYLQLYRR